MALTVFRLEEIGETPMFQGPVHLLEVQVVEDAVAAQHDDVALVGAHAVHRAATFDDLQRQLLHSIRCIRCDRNI